MSAGRFLLLTALVCFSCIPKKILSEKLVLFPFCPQNENLQSERLNNLHKIFYQASESVGKKNTDFIYNPDLKTGCAIKTNRTIAASLNSDLFLDAIYLIEGDSVELKVKLVYTRFIDKIASVDPVRGSLQKLNDCILGTFRNIFSQLKISPDAGEWVKITSLVMSDANTYPFPGDAPADISKEPVTAADNNSNFLLGKAAFETGNFNLAIEHLQKVQTEEKTYSEAQFMLGKSLLSRDDFSKAYACFRRCSDRGFSDPSLDNWMNSASLLSKPAEYFNTYARRKEWWDKLNTQELKSVLMLMNNLKINGKEYEDNYQYIDADISALFQITELPLKNGKYADLQVFRYFTHTDVIVLENCKLNSDDGLQYLHNVKTIRTDMPINLAQINFLQGQNKLLVIFSKSRK